jgi:integrase
MTNWKKTRFVGVRVKESLVRRHNSKPDKYFLIRYGKDGKIIQEAAGWASEGITAQFASNLRAEILSNIRLGKGFQSLKEKRQREETKKRVKEGRGITLQQAFDEFLKVRTIKPRTQTDYQRSMDTAFADWKQRPVVGITRDLISQRHQKLKADAQANFKKKTKGKAKKPTKDEIQKRGGAYANLNMRFLRSLLNFCAGYYEDPVDGGPLIKNNPVDRLGQTRQWFKVDRRRTHIKPKDFPRWFKAVLNMDNETVRGYLLLLLFCGLRKQEGLRLEKSHVNIEDKVFTVMDTKNLKPLQLPIPGYILPLLKERVESDDESKFVFPGTGKSGHLVEPKRPIQSVIKASKVDFCLNDLRRFFITVAEGLDVSSYAVKALVNHSLGSDVTAGYIAPDVERLRKPMTQIERKILVMAGVQGKGKIVKLKTG